MHRGCLRGCSPSEAGKFYILETELCSWWILLGTNLIKAMKRNSHFYRLNRPNCSLWENFIFFTKEHVLVPLALRATHFFFFFFLPLPFRPALPPLPRYFWTLPHHWNRKWGVTLNRKHEDSFYFTIFFPTPINIWLGIGDRGSGKASGNLIALGGEERRRGSRFLLNRFIHDCRCCTKRSLFYDSWYVTTSPSFPYVFTHILFKKCHVLHTNK